MPTYRDQLDAARKQIVQHALIGSGGNVARAARDLVLTRTCLYALLRRFHLRGRGPHAPKKRSIR